MIHQRKPSTPTTPRSAFRGDYGTSYRRKRDIIHRKALLGPSSRRLQRHGQSHSKTVAFIVACILVILFGTYKILLKEWLFNTEVASSPPSGHRIAIVIPFVADSSGTFPPYFPIFLTSAAGSAELFDFLIFYSGVKPHFVDSLAVPGNVKLIDMKKSSKLAFLIMQRLLYHKLNAEEHDPAFLDKEKFHELVVTYTRHITTFPYSLVEIKGAMGFIFEYFLVDYSHWGYSDLDVVFGDLPRWVTKDELEVYDIVTYGFGDQDRVYLRGQFTFMKNVKDVNLLWRECTYLSDIDLRFDDLENLRFESAEGCLSAVVLRQKNLKVKYAVKAFTDVAESRSSGFSQAVYVGTGENADRSVVYKAKHNDATTEKDVLALPFDWFERPEYQYSDRSMPMQKYVGEIELVEFLNEYEDAHCMYWAPGKYQHEICAANVDWYDDAVFLIDGVLYKQSFETMEMPAGVETAPFYHFQEWKRTYRSAQIASMRSRNCDIAGWALMKEGAVPLPWLSDDKHNKNSKPADRIKSEVLPTLTFCLQSSRNERPPYSSVCDRSITWQDEKNVRILSSGGNWDNANMETDISLALTLQITSFQAAEEKTFHRILDVAEANINSWSSMPSVLIIHVSGVSGNVEKTLEKRLLDRVSGSRTFVETLVAAIFTPGNAAVSRKALLNMASAVCPTRWVVGGLELERGLIISSETPLFAKRAADIYNDSRGTIFMVPALASSTPLDGRNELRSVNFSEFELHKDSITHQLAIYDCISDCLSDVDEDSFISKTIYELWMAAVGAEILLRKENVNRENFETALNKFELFLIDMLSPDKFSEFIDLNISPIIMIDNMGPFPGMITKEIALEVDELAGAVCYNGLRFAQLLALGYNLKVLPGAFALSDPISRSAARGYAAQFGDGPFENICDEAEGQQLDASRCNGCLISSDDYDLVEYIALEEIRRPIKASLLWNDAYVQRERIK